MVIAAITLKPICHTETHRNQKNKTGCLFPSLSSSYLLPEKVLSLRQSDYRVPVRGKGADAQQNCGVLERHGQRHVDQEVDEHGPAQRVPEMWNDIKVKLK